MAALMSDLLAMADSLTPSKPRPRLRPGVLYVDPRVGSREFLPLLQKRGLRVALADPMLRSGDFAFRCGHVDRSPFCDGKFGCTIGIERKTLSDMIGSLLKHRLNKQIPDMLDDYTVSYLLLEGIYQPGPDDEIQIYRQGGWVSARSGLTYTQLERWLVRYDTMGWGRIRRWRTNKAMETVVWIAAVYGWWQKEWKLHHAEAVDKMPHPVKALMWRPSQLQRTAASLPEIGIKNAKKVGRHFASIREMVCADIDEWQSLIGKADGKRVYDEIQKRYR